MALMFVSTVRDSAFCSPASLQTYTANLCVIQTLTNGFMEFIIPIRRPLADQVLLVINPYG